jgi:hypothetical protein
MKYELVDGESELGILTPCDRRAVESRWQAGWESGEADCVALSTLHFDCIGQSVEWAGEEGCELLSRLGYSIIDCGPESSLQSCRGRVV